MQKLTSTLESNAEGVSIVICCHNSSERLGQTLSCLVSQNVQANFKWEVVVVDNASTDNIIGYINTLKIDTIIPDLRIVYEPKLGLNYAKERGVAESKYEYICFVDDDNWVCPDWVRLVAEILNDNPDVAACGGRSEAVFEVEPPLWFDRFAYCYAVGAQRQVNTDILGVGQCLWGAGFSVRRSALTDLEKHGFKHMLSGRKGRSLSSGEDTELSLALKLRGWRLLYDERLKLQHYMPASRLRWVYLRQLNYSFGLSSPLLDLYVYSEYLRSSNNSIIKVTWLYQVLAVVKDLMLHPFELLKAIFLESEGDSTILQIEYKLGRLAALLKMCTSYQRRLKLTASYLAMRYDETSKLGGGKSRHRS